MGDGSTRWYGAGNFFCAKKGECDLEIGNCDTASAVNAGGPKRKRNGRQDQGDSLMLGFVVLVSFSRRCELIQFLLQGYVVATRICEAGWRLPAAVIAMIMQEGQEPASSFLSMRSVEERRGEKIIKSMNQSQRFRVGIEAGVGTLYGVNGRIPVLCTVFPVPSTCHVT